MWSGFDLLCFVRNKESRLANADPEFQTWRRDTGCAKAPRDDTGQVQKAVFILCEETRAAGRLHCMGDQSIDSTSIPRQAH